MWFATAGQLLGDLAAIDSDSALRRRLCHDAAPALRVIDEVGYLSYSNRHADLLFELINRRHESRSTLITTNRSFSDRSSRSSRRDRRYQGGVLLSQGGAGAGGAAGPETSIRRRESPMKPDYLPSGLGSGIAFLICADWTPDQALAVVELLEDLRDRIRAHDELALFDLLREERDSPGEHLPANHCPADDWPDEPPF